MIGVASRVIFILIAVAGIFLAGSQAIAQARDEVGELNAQVVAHLRLYLYYLGRIRQVCPTPKADGLADAR